MASHFALFVDLENCGGKKSMLMDVIERVKIRSDILIGKLAILRLAFMPAGSRARKLQFAISLHDS